MERAVDRAHHLSRPPRTVLRALLALLVAVALAACGSSGGGEDAGADTSSESSSESSESSEPAPEPEPPPEETDPTTGSSSGQDNPAISVARLPVGGGAPGPHNGDPSLQCAEVSWIVDNDGEIPQGVAVEITEVLYTPEGVFETVDEGCGTPQPNCVGYVFRAADQRCDLLVRVVGTVPDGVSPRVGFAGLVYCPPDDAPSCREFVAALGDQKQISAELLVPPQPEPETT